MHATALCHLSKLQIAVVGSGLSGCSVAYFLRRRVPECHVDMYERLPVPFGQLRYGVAPDRGETSRSLCQRFLRLLESDGVTWMGNISIGREISLRQLQDVYTIVVLAPGTSTMGHFGEGGELAGAHLPNVVGSRDLLSHFATLPHPYGDPNRCPLDFEDATDVVVVGGDAAAMDVARIVAAPYRRWCPSAMNARAVKFLADKNFVRRVTVTIDGSPTFGADAWRPLVGLGPNVRVRVEGAGVDGGDDERTQRVLRMMRRCTAEETPSSAGESAPVLQRRRPFRAPVRAPCEVLVKLGCCVDALLPHPKKPRVGGVQFTMDGETKYCRCDAVVWTPRESVEGLFDDIPKCDGRLQHASGRVTSCDGLYCSGSAKRADLLGSPHVFYDSMETVNTIVNDLAEGRVLQQENHNGKFGLLDYIAAKKILPLFITAAQRIFHVESERGIDLGKHSERLASVHDMIGVGEGGTSGKRAERRVRGIVSERPPHRELLDEFLNDTPVADLSADLKGDFMLLRTSRHYRSYKDIAPQ